jgi:diguanylate cyclase (GGDEF)-like protein/PAS domain S-box-containing protein
MRSRQDVNGPGARVDEPSVNPDHARLRVVEPAVARVGFDPGPILASLPDIVLVIDPLAQVRWANRAAERMFGLRLGDVEGHSALEFVHPDDVQVAALSVSSVQHKEVGSLIEIRVRAAAGWRLVELVGAPFGDDVLLSIRDITERRRWEVAGNHVARFRSLMQNAASLTMLLTPEGVVEASSGALTRLLGHDQEWLEGRPLADVVESDDRDVLDSVLRDVQRADCEAARTTAVLRLRHVDSTPVPFALTFTNLLRDPTVEGLVVTGHDITDRVAAERQLRVANSVLAATLDSTADGILVVDLEGRIRSFNSRFAEMWRIPDEILESRDDRAALDFVLEQLSEPEAFLAKVQELYATPEARSHDIICFKDGRVFERDSLPQRIEGEVVGRVWSFHDITEQQRLRNDLAHQALHDPLTGLANQVLFRDRVDHAAARLQRRGGMVAVLFVDLDDFKTVNDSLGHSVGDELLVEVARRLLRSVRPEDTVARLGGDEFAVLIDDVDDRDAAVSVADRVLEALRVPVTLAARTMSATASIGIAYDTAGAGADELLRNADLAMYTAKAGGKNCARVFAPDMHAAAVERLDLEARLRGAVERGELVLHYQPIYELRSGTVTAMEALVRWRHPTRGLLGPGSFVPFAEAGGLIDEIGFHVLETACAQARHWERRFGAGAPAVSVNLSPRQLVDPDFPSRVEELLRACGLAPERLILEITEGALMSDPKAGAARLRRLAQIGVRLAVDDFGTGYSALSYLQEFPVGILKIDGVFVHDGLVASGWSLAQAIIQIAHALGLVPIAEGVETAAQAEALLRLGCEYAQGYHLGRPVDAAAALELLERARPS